jgi:hypothetical protein
MSLGTRLRAKRFWRSVLDFLSVLGPGIITSILDNDS